jgi:tetratricopeptide (TPR) repeat protein
MTSSAKTSVVLTAAIVLSFAAALMAEYRLQQMHSVSAPKEILYIPSANTIRRMSLGYTGLVADIYWTRAVQYFGGKHVARAQEYNLLAPLLDITTDLDPKLIVAYRFGAIFLAQRPPDGAGQPDKAVALVEKGIRNNPDDWHLYYDLGFIEYMERHDYLAAAKAFERGSKVPGAHPFLRLLAASMAQHGGELQTARQMWTLTYQSTDDKSLKANALEHLKALEVDEAVPQLEALVQRYRQATGSLPASFFELLRAGYLRGIPVDPAGYPYKLLPDGRVVVQDPKALPFITQGLPPGYRPE